MPAYAEEIEEAQQEGVVLRTLISPEAFVVHKGSVTGIQCREMKLGEFDRSGRRRPDAEEGGGFIEKADQIILAIGQKLDAPALLTPYPVELTSGGWIKIDPVCGATSEPWLFSGGDSASGPSSVVEAIGAGERAAVGIDEMLTGKKHAFWREYHEVQTDYNPEADPVPYPREQISSIPVERRQNNFDEVERPWNEATAVRQAKRCLRCDYGKGACPAETAERAESGVRL
jgi:NADH-quinone oxidoreductase subunit F